MIGKIAHHTIESPEIIIGDTDLDKLKGDLARMASDGVIEEFEYLGEDANGIHRFQTTAVEPIKYITISQTLHK